MVRAGTPGLQKPIPPPKKRLAGLTQGDKTGRPAGGLPGVLPPGSLHLSVSEGPLCVWTTSSPLSGLLSTAFRGPGSRRRDPPQANGRAPLGLGDTEGFLSVLLGSGSALWAPPPWQARGLLRFGIQAISHFPSLARRGAGVLGELRPGTREHGTDSSAY